MDKRSIAEIATLYELEPSLKNIWVEGSTDQAAIEWFAKAASLHDIDVMTCDDVEISSEICAKYGLLPSNRSRLISFALELEQLISAESETAKILTIIDRDIDDLFDRKISGRYIEYTERSSLEMYFSEPELISKLLHMSKADPSDDCFRATAIEVSLSITSIRAAAQIIGENWTWVSFNSSFKRKNKNKGPWAYDKSDHISRFLNSNAAMGRIEEVLALASEMEGRAKGRELSITRGHDFIEVLFCMIKDLIRPKDAINTSDGLFITLFMGASMEYLMQFELFRKIVGFAEIRAAA